MKKIMLSMAVAAIGAVAVADTSIESSNVVGYQNKGMVNGAFVWCAGTFVPTDADPSAMTLGHMVPSRSGGSMTSGKLRLSFFGTGAANLKLSSGPYAGQSATFVYLDAEELEELQEEEPETYGTVTVGWYHEKDDDFEHPMNSYVVPYGLGYSIRTTQAGYSIRWSGEVAKEADMPSVNLVNGSFVWTGNAAPKAMALRDFALSRTSGSMTSGKARLSFFGAGAANLKLVSGPYTGQSATFVYLDAEELEELQEEEPETYGTVTVGWYHEKDGDYENPMNSYEIDAGAGFAVRATQTGYVLDLPSAL